jgi:hypothetical protein
MCDNLSWLACPNGERRCVIALGLTHPLFVVLALQDLGLLLLLQRRTDVCG